MQVPVVFSFAIAPLVLLFLHAYTLIRYDMLAANLRQFRTDLLASVPLEVSASAAGSCSLVWNSSRCARHRRDHLCAASLPTLVLLVLAGFPVATLLAIQISSLRYQSDVITKAQQVSIALDLALLLWFFLRHRLRRETLPKDPFRLGWVWYCVPLVLILILDPLYLNVPGANNKTVRGGDHGPNWSEAYEQPLDLVLCPTLQWGCRYLTIDHRTLVGHVWKPEAIADLRAEKVEPQGIINALLGKKVSVEDSLAAMIEGVFLRSRSLRFAKFDESRLYAADMIRSDLRSATLRSTQLQGTNLSGADLRGADLTRANLSEVDVSVANLAGRT